MKRYTVAAARERFAAVLDEADRTGAVMIERRDVRYVIRPERPRRQPARRSAIRILDPAVAAGQWRWTASRGGLRFRASRRS